MTILFFRNNNNKKKEWYSSGRDDLCESEGVKWAERLERSAATVFSHLVDLESYTVDLRLGFRSREGGENSIFSTRLEIIFLGRRMGRRKRIQMV